MSAGKGDTPRPVDGQTYRNNWEAIFGNKKPEDKRPDERDEEQQP